MSGAALQAPQRARRARAYRALCVALVAAACAPPPAAQQAARGTAEGTPRFLDDDGAVPWDLPAGLPIAPLVIDPAAFTPSQAHDLIPPIPYPAPHDGDVHVWLTNATAAADDGVGALTLPGGTLARVERRLRGGHWRIVDVRGAFTRAGTEHFFVARPAASGLLVGLAWPRADAHAERAAHEAMAARLWDAHSTGGARAARTFVTKGQCLACHTPRLHDGLPRSDGGFTPVRRTDVHGFYALSDLWRLERPNEHYGSEAAQAFVQSATSSRSYALAAALRAGEPRAREVCASRAAASAVFGHPTSFDPTTDPCTSTPKATP